jgi:hypothetical protein
VQMKVMLKSVARQGNSTKFEGSKEQIKEENLRRESDRNLQGEESLNFL